MNKMEMDKKVFSRSWWITSGVLINVWFGATFKKSGRKEVSWGKEVRKRDVSVGAIHKSNNQNCKCLEDSQKCVHIERKG